MTTNLDTQVRYPTGIEAIETKKPRIIDILDDADLDAVDGGTGEVHDACVRVALGILFLDAHARWAVGDMYRTMGPCP